MAGCVPQLRLDSALSLSPARLRNRPYPGMEALTIGDPILLHPTQSGAGPGRRMCWWRFPPSPFLWGSCEPGYRGNTRASWCQEVWFGVPAVGRSRLGAPAAWQLEILSPGKVQRNHLSPGEGLRHRGQPLLLGIGGPGRRWLQVQAAQRESFSTSPLHCKDMVR